MMNTLLESKPRKEGKTGGTIFSVVVHSLIVFFAVYASANAGVAEVRDDRAEKVTFVKTKAPEPPPVLEKKAEPPPPPKAEPKKAEPKKAAPKPPSRLPVAPKAEIAPPKGFKVLAAPVNIPTTIPTIDLSAKITNEDDFSGRGTRGGSSTGVGGSSGTKEGAAGGSTVDTNRSYAEFEVERQVRAISGTAVDYPESMRSSGAEGQVLAEFVVNENGRVVTSSFKVLESSNSSFTQAVRNALSRMRFQPAQIGSTKVSQVVQQAFVFKLSR